MYTEFNALENLYISFDSRLNNLENDVAIIKSDIAELKSAITRIDNNLQNLTMLVIHNQEKNDLHHQYLGYTMGIGFAVMAIVVALVSIRRDNSSNTRQSFTFFHSFHSWLPRKYIPWIRR